MKLSLVGCMLSIMIAQAYAAAPEEDMKRLLEQNKPSEAYQVGKANHELIGQAAFDFYFGIASIDSGAPGEGALALERYLLQFPENRSARFHLARAYYVLGEDQLARMGFTEIIDGADEQDLIAINKYLDAIRARESRYLPTATFYAEVGVGHDSNINGGVRSGQVNGLPLGIVIANGSTGEQESDWFSTVTVGGQGALPIAPGISLYGGAKLGGRWNGASDNNIYDQRSGNLIGGISFLTGRNMFRLGGDYSHISIDKQSYLQVASLVGDWTHQLNQFDRFVLSLQWGQAEL
jgi:outer membrane protein